MRHDEDGSGLLGAILIDWAAIILEEQVKCAAVGDQPPSTTRCRSVSRSLPCSRNAVCIKCRCIRPVISIIPFALVLFRASGRPSLHSSVTLRQDGEHCAAGQTCGHFLALLAMNWARAAAIGPFCLPSAGQLSRRSRALELGAHSPALLDTVGAQPCRRAPFAPTRCHSPSSSRGSRTGRVRSRDFPRSPHFLFAGCIAVGLLVPALVGKPKR